MVHNHSDIPLPHTEEQTDKSSDSIAIIGAGVIGLCSALHAQARGYQVTLYDKDQPGKGASFGNAGYLATELIDPLATVSTLKIAPWLWLNPKGPLFLPITHLPKVLPWLNRFIKAASHDKASLSREALTLLNQESVPAWRRLLEAVGAEDELVNSGYLLVWEKQTNKQAALNHIRYMQSSGIPCEYVEGARLEKLEPELAKCLSHAVYYPEACRVRDPYQLSDILFKAFQRQGGHFICDEINQIIPEQGKVRVIRKHSATTNKDIYNKAIICTGAWSRKLLNNSGIDIPLEAERGYHITLPNQQIHIKHAIGSAERRFVMTPLDSGLRAVGVTELGGLKHAPVPQRFRMLKHHMLHMLPILKSIPDTSYEKWMGHRPTLPDSLPVIDKHPKHSDILFAFGNQHLGLTQAAATAELVVSLAQGEQGFMSRDYFSVSRF